MPQARRSGRIGSKAAAYHATIGADAAGVKDGPAACLGSIISGLGHVP